MRYIIPDEIKDEVLERYTSGDRPKNIAIALGINDWNVSVIVRRAGVARNMVDAQQLILSRQEWIGNRRYTVNHAAFSRITPDSAYWAGFLMADGCVQGNKVRLKLSVSDINHLEKFRAFVGTDAPIMIDRVARYTEINGRAIQGQAAAFVTVASEQITKALASFGITERKTFSANACGGMETSRDFWRGEIDGDGSIIFNGRKPYLAARGTRRLMDQFLKFCNDIKPTNINIRPEGNIFKVYMNCGNAVRVIDALYRNAATSLDRKAEKAMIILTHPKHQGYV